MTVHFSGILLTMKPALSLLLLALLSACTSQVGLFAPQHQVRQGYLYQYQAQPTPDERDIELTVWAAPLSGGEWKLEDELQRYAKRYAQEQDCISYRLDHITLGQYNTFFEGKRYVRGVMNCTKRPSSALQPTTLAPAPVVPFLDRQHGGK